MAKSSNRSGGNNPPVHSKAVRRYGSNATTGHQPTSPLRDQAPPSVAVTKEYPYGTPRGETVGIATDGSGKFTRPSYPLASHRASGDGVHHERAPTTGAAGQAHSASGGTFGKPQRR